MIKRFLLAAVLAAFSFQAQAQSLFESTILAPLTGAHVRTFDATTSKVLTSNFMADSEVIRVLCTAACLVQTAISGKTPVAVIGGVTGSTLIPANVPEYIRAPKNGKLAVIGLSAAGIIYVQEFGR